MPLGGVAVRLEPVSGQNVIAGLSMLQDELIAGMPGSRSTDSEGMFTLETNAPGAYRVVVGPGMAAPSYVAATFPGRETASILTLTPGQVLGDLVIALNRGGVINGRVVDENGQPLSLVTVAIEQVLAGDRLRQPSSHVAAAGDRTDDRGVFRIFGIATGTYLLRAQSYARPAMGPDDRSSVRTFPPTYYPSTMVTAEATRVSVRAGEEYGPVDIVLQRAQLRTVRGVIVDSTGSPVPNVTIQLLGPKARLGQTGVGSVRSDAAGAFEMHGIPPGDYALGAHAFGGGRQEFGWMPLPPDGSGVVFKLQPGASITGDVVFDGTSTPGSAAVMIRPVEGTGASPTPSTRASADGQFVIANLFGPMLIRVDAVPGWSLKSVLYGGRDIIDEPTDFVSGAKIRVVLGDRMAVLRGVVTIAAKPALDSVVVLLGEHPSQWHERASTTRSVTVGLDGSYRIDGLRAGTYRAIALPREIASLSDAPAGFYELLAARGVQVEVRDGEPQSLDLQLTRDQALAK